MVRVTSGLAGNIERLSLTWSDSQCWTLQHVGMLGVRTPISDNIIYSYVYEYSLVAIRRTKIQSAEVILLSLVQ